MVTTNNDVFVEKMIPSDFRMISGCRDHQTSADVSNVSSFKLPDPAGQAGGACTSTLLQILYHGKKDTGKNLSFEQVLNRMRVLLKNKGYSQVPQLTGSRKVELRAPFHVVPPGSNGVKRALLIGINYTGQEGALTGCHNDVFNMRDYLVEVQGFKKENIAILVDDGKNYLPTKKNILWAVQSLVRNCRSGDVVFTHFSGHGGRVKDTSGDEADGYDECLVPVNFKEAGFIKDDDLYTALVGPMSRGVTVTSLMDCCHSGTVLDLPYHFKADGNSHAMVMPSSFSLAHLQQLVGSFHNNMKRRRDEIMAHEFQEFADAMLLPGEGCNGDDVVQLFRNGFQAKYKAQGLYLTYNECAKLLGDWNQGHPKAKVTPHGWFMGFHINPSKVRPEFRA